MTFEQLILERVRELPPDKQKEVLEYVESLRNLPPNTSSSRNLAGLWADLNFHVTEDDIAEARREMWGSFPRDIES